MTKDAFIREVRNAEAMLYHISKSILKNDSDCGDAVQETLLKAYEKLPMLKEEKFFRTWITRILINECKGILRKQKKVVQYEDYMGNERLSEENRYHHLYMAIMELPEDLRILVTLYYIEGFSQKEISEILEIPEGTIKSRLSRARDFLKTQLSDEEEKSSIFRKNSKMSNKVTGKGKMPC
ncbi:RNA polymerase sigma factor [Blautia sp.]